MPVRKWMERKWVRRIIWIVIAVTVLTALGVGIGLYWLPYHQAASHMPIGEILTLKWLPDSRVELTWPQAERTDYYLVEVTRETETENEDGEKETTVQVVYSVQVNNSLSTVLPKLPAEEELTIRVRTMVRYEHPGQTKIRPGDDPLETTLQLQPPVIENLLWTADPAADSVTITFDMRDGDCARLYYLDEQGHSLLRTLESGETTITFGPEGDLPMLEHGTACKLQLESFRDQSGSTFVSCPSDTITLIREDLLDRDLRVQLTDEGDNICTLIWSETKGETYELQVRTSERDPWTTILTVEQTGKRVYTTDRLRAFSNYDFRVVALGGQCAEDGVAAVSDVTRFRTGVSVLYSTIWPIKELKVYTTPEMTETLGTVAGGATLCVVEDHGTVFGIRWDDETIGYIDSNYCMINVAEYLGDLCAYDITNSYYSIYKINKYDIPRVTGTVIVGYEHVKLQDGTYLVPLLYPVAQKLMAAGLKAYEAGYRLKIFDAYRPNRATVMLYDRAEKLLEDPVPGKIPDPTEDDPERLLTYGAVMTYDGEYPLNYFLAKGASLHNLGIALDLTIEKLEDGKQQPMQSQMHDLSYYSMIYRNNQNANLLKSFMEGAGFGGLISEWWHFQDNDIRNTLTLPALWGGISAEGWKKDDYGWRWRYADGTYAADCTLTIGDRSYSFDARGYVTES